MVLPKGRIKSKTQTIGVAARLAPALFFAYPHLPFKEDLATEERGSKEVGRSPRPFHHRNLFVRQPVQVIHQTVYLRVRGLNLLQLLNG